MMPPMDEIFGDLEKLRAAVIDFWPEGEARDLWLKWIDQVAAETESVTPDDLKFYSLGLSLDARRQSH